MEHDIDSLIELKLDKANPPSAAADFFCCFRLFLNIMQSKLDSDILNKITEVYAACMTHEVDTRENTLSYQAYRVGLN